MAKRKNPDEKREKKRAALIERTATIMDIPQPEAVQRLTTPLAQGVRINPLKGSRETTLAAMRSLGWTGEPHPWCADGWTIKTGYEALRDSTLITNGAIYIQNPSSWLPVTTLAPEPGERVLDVCAAPGGKASHIAARQMNAGELIVNDNSRARLAKLRANLNRLGVHADYVLYDATRLASHFDGASFDKILLDAPCSGEGLINLALPKSLDTWSVAHIRRLSGVQKKIITQAWRLLKPGGRLVYSTCTMAPEENEAVADFLIKHCHDARVTKLEGDVQAAVLQWNNRLYDAQVARAGRVFPGDGNEAFFVCSFEKTASE